MILKLEENPVQKDIEILVSYPHMNRIVERLVTAINAVDHTIKCASQTGDIWVNASDIFYIESVDKRTFVYCENSVFQTEQRLYQLIDNLSSLDFVQISKSCLLNVNVLSGIRPLMNSKMEATLSNGEKLDITRKYIYDIKAKLQER